MPPETAHSNSVRMPLSFSFSKTAAEGCLQIGAAAGAAQAVDGDGASQQRAERLGIYETIV